MNAEDIHKAALAAHSLRPKWGVQSLKTFLGNHFAEKPMAEVMKALTAVAMDPAAQTPNLMLKPGPWWGAPVRAAAGPETQTPGPGDEPACERVGHEHELARNCRACAAERHADTEADESPMVPAEPPAAIVAVANRHRVKAAAAPLTRSFAQPEDLRQPDPMSVSSCARRGCGGYYVADGDGAAAHKTVFGHLPEVAVARPEPEESR